VDGVKKWGLLLQTWGEDPNISKLMRAIADGELKVNWGDEESPMTNKQRSVMKGAIALIQEGLSQVKAEKN
jgi:hypothetical protein